MSADVEASMAWEKVAKEVLFLGKKKKIKLHEIKTPALASHAPDRLSIGDLTGRSVAHANRRKRKKNAKNLCAAS
jgi:hypothetical protein